MHLFEPLEQRSMLSVSLAHGILNLKGNAATNMFQVFYSAALRKIVASEYTAGTASVAKSFNPKQVKQIKAVMGGGNDVLGVVGVAKVPVYFDAGPGDDTLTLSGTKVGCKIYGRDGNDILNGSAGKDLIDGGNGNDRLFGGDGNDTITGGAGQDYISGGNGNDVINVKDGELDEITGGSGVDRATVDLLSATQTPNETGVGTDIETILG